MITEAEVKEVIEKQTTLQWLAINEITFDMTYQRQLSTDKVRAISAKFNPIAAGNPLVNIRENGEIVGIDGRHRIEAMKKLGELFVECRVCKGLSQEQEAQIFIYCNTVRKNPNALDVFKARLAIKDDTALAIVSIVEKCGLTICFFGTGGHQRVPKGIYAVTTLEEIYTRRGAKFLEDTLRIVIRCWPDNGHALDWMVLKGVAEFRAKYEGRYTNVELVRKMNDEGFEAILRRAKAHAEIMGGATYITFAVVMQEVYDKGRRHLRLEPNKA